ncbi:MAG: DUF4249 domain-containing protein [Chitinophagales bacterium]|nr:DUF4249 domain-containing protein [Chitinophagales bacterium]
MISFLRNSIFILLSVIIFSSCLKKYDLDFDQVGKNLTLNADVETDHTVEALITLTKSPLDYDNYITPSDAKVDLYENGVWLESLKYVSKNGQLGIYTSQNKIQALKTYTIKASYKDLPIISATQTTFDSPNIESISMDKDVRAIADSGTMHVQVHITETNVKRRYFSIINFFEIHRSNDDETETVSWNIIDINLPKSFKDDRNYSNIVTDNPQNISYNLNFRNMEEFQSDNVRAVWFYIEVLELSEDGYLYKKTYRKRGDDNFNEPTLVYSNIENGFGIFSTFSRTLQVFPVKGYR